MIKYVRKFVRCAVQTAVTMEMAFPWEVGEQTTLEMKKADSHEILVTIYQTSQYHI
jgi:hypothetical protein